MLGEFPGVGFGHDVRGERTGRVRDIDNAGLECIADLEWWHGLRSADVIDLDETFPFRVYLIDEFFKASRVSGFLGEGRYSPESDFLGKTR
jgi:hypothetical protein